MKALICLLALAGLSASESFVVYDANSLLNTYGLEVASDNTMAQWQISAPGNLTFVPKDGSYMYTVFKCKDYSAYTGVEITMTAPKDAEFTLALQTSDNQCTRMTSQSLLNVKEFVTFDGTKKTFHIPFSHFTGLDQKNVWALVLDRFNTLDKNYILHSVAFTNTTVSVWSNYYVYKNGDEHYLAECVKTRLQNDLVYSVNMCPVITAPTGNNARLWASSCKRALIKDNSDGHWHFKAISGNEFSNLLLSGYAYSPQGLGRSSKSPVLTTSYKALTITDVSTSIMSGTDILVTTETSKVPRTETVPTTSIHATTIMVPKTIISTKVGTKTIGTSTMTFVEATEVITPWPTTVTTTSTFTTTVVYEDISTSVQTKTVPYTTPIVATTVYTDTYGPFYTSN